MITIEKNIPVPPSTKVLEAALDRMEVHDSFLLPDEANMRSMLFRVMRAHKNSFISRTDANAGGVRVWRVA